MHYMMILKASADCEMGKRPSEATLSAIRIYTQELRKAGALVELSRLHPSSKGARVKLSGGNRVVMEGPFAETKELVGGYWVIEANSMGDAIEWAKRVPAADGDGVETEIEIRQFQELEDFVPGETGDRPLGAGKEFAKA
jgi:PhnB protein